MKNYVFVYGTLMTGYWNHGLLADSKLISTATTVEKYVMFSHSIPFVSESQKVSRIHGELYSVSFQTLNSLDALESYNIQSLETSWYTRKEIQVELADSTIETALIYFNEKENAPIVQTGNFRDLSAYPETSEDLWYFAYGSNMNPARMIRREVKFTRRIKGALSDYALAFDKKAYGKNYSYANIHKSPGSNTLGILYRVSKDSLDTLDGYEGVSSGHYYRKALTVNSDQGPIDALVYIACPEHVKSGLRPTEEYLSHLEKGVDVVGEELHKTTNPSK